MTEGDLVARKRISPRSFFPSYVLLALYEILLLATAIATGRLVSHIWVFAAFAIVPLAWILVHSWLVRISTEYRIYEDSLEVESGIISRNIDNIQLFRVRDVGLTQGILGRILNYGSILITSTDRSNPHLILKGVDDPKGMYDTLRGLIARSQAQRRTMIVEDDADHSHALES